MIGTENTEIPTVTISITIPGGHLMQANDLSKSRAVQVCLPA